MLLPDVNVLVYAHREDAVEHPRYRGWLQDLLASDSAYGISELVLCAFVRIVTHPKICREPTPLEPALAFAGEVRDRPNAAVLSPGPRHWEIFTRYCASSLLLQRIIPAKSLKQSFGICQSGLLLNTVPG